MYLGRGFCNLDVCTLTVMQTITDSGDSLLKTPNDFQHVLNWDIYLFNQFTLWFCMCYYKIFQKKIPFKPKL
jgi:hypothetical protein